MDFFEYDKDCCRICLNNTVVTNWNEEIFELCGMTYKDCYFKYTQLEETDPDPFSTMLCERCSVNLKKFHFFVEKALESFRVLRQSYAADFLIDEELKDNSFTKHESEELKYNPSTKQESEDLKDNLSTKQESESLEVCQISQSNESLTSIENNENATCDRIIDFENDEADTGTIESETVVIQPSLDQVFSEEEVDDIQIIEYEQVDAIEEYTESKIEKTLSSSPSKCNVNQNKGNEPSKLISYKRLRSASKRKAAEIKEEPDREDNRSKSPSPSPEGRKKKRKKGEALMCAYCSQILADIYSLRKHEATHDKNRERKEICPNCGLKFYTKMSLRNHMLTHKENREKPYKCEFCEKAYFNRGGLNVHRRMHLGLMIKCSFCPKEFCRQIDLDVHLKSHSSTPLHSVKRTPTFLVHCKDCNKQIPSRRWKAHQAAHKNEPQIRCTICNRDFFSRKNCTKHINKMHNKTKEEYDTYMHYYVEKTERRTSHLLLEQTLEITPKPLK